MNSNLAFNNYDYENHFYNYDEENDYDKRYVTEECLCENKAIKKYFSDIQKGIIGKRILDLGCGTGFLLDLMGKDISQHLYLGVDVSNTLLSVAVRKYPYAKFIYDDAGAATKRLRGQYDIVTSIFSIPYIEETTIKETYRLLKQGGIFFTVYYEFPFLNPSSIYADKREHYLNDVQPQVYRCVKAAETLFETVYKVLLTPSGAYNVAAFKKG